MSISKPIEGLVFENRLNVSVKENPHAKAGLAALGGKVCDTAKGVSDICSFVLKGTQLFHAVLPGSATALSEKIESVSFAGRNMTSIPQAIVVGNEFIANKKPRDGAELVKMTVLSVAAFHPDQVASKACVGVGTMAGVVVDSADLYKEVKLRNACSIEVPKGTDERVKKAVENQHWVSTMKIAKICLQLFSGIVASMAWLLAITLHPTLAIAALVASFSAVVLSFGLQYVEHTSELTSKITLLQPKETAAAV